MSTSPETSPSPSPSNRADHALAAVASAALFVGVCFWGWSKMTAAPARPAISYADAMPGDETTWCVDHYGPETSYTEGKPANALVWTNEPAVPRTIGSTSGSGRCSEANVLVVERRNGSVLVEYQGRP